MLRRICVLSLGIFLVYGGVAMALELTSLAFNNTEVIPKQYTCQGQDISPPLRWSGTPEGVKSFALISDDPDAPMGTWVHWVLYDIPAATTELPEEVAMTLVLADGSKQGMTDFGRVGYGGPCPPPGKYHRYFFKLYALDTMLNVNAGITKEELLGKMQGHILAEAKLMGRYKR
ncbi:YbhB/YbcL family Raf kinase inhibitor-like protein [Candidatus Omnitrophota bacterium]